MNDRACSSISWRRGDSDGLRWKQIGRGVLIEPVLRLENEPPTNTPAGHESALLERARRAGVESLIKSTPQNVSRLMVNGSADEQAAARREWQLHQKANRKAVGRVEWAKCGRPCV